MAPKFRALLESDEYLNASSPNLTEAMQEMDTASLLLHARNVELFAQMKQAEEYKGATPQDVCDVLCILPNGDPLPRAETIPADGWTGLLPIEAYEDEEILPDIACARCGEEIAPHAVGSPVVSERVYLSGTPRERTLSQLESGVLAITFPGGQEAYYCAAHVVDICEGCGCTYEVGCVEECHWLPRARKPNFCSNCETSWSQSEIFEVVDSANQVVYRCDYEKNRLPEMIVSNHETGKVALSLDKVAGTTMLSTLTPRHWAEVMIAAGQVKP